MPTLQVQLDDSLMEALKTHASTNGKTIKSVIVGWILGINDQSLTHQGESNGDSMTLQQQQLELSSSLLEQAVLQTQLLQQLTHQAATTPHGGTGPRRVVITEPEVIPSGLMSAAEFMSPPAPSTPDGYRAVEESEAVKGLEVWMKNRSVFGVVLEAPVGGVTRVQSSDPGRAPEHVHVDQLMVPINA
jgi:hypothetical protein